MKRHSSAKAGVTAIFLLLTAFSRVSAELSYSVVDLGTLGGATSTANGINAAGDVVGSAALADGSSHGFLYKNGKMEDLATLGGAGGTANGNNPGNIVGAADIPETTAYHAFLRADQVTSDLGTLGGNQSSAQGINKPGQIVGFSTANDNSVRAFLSIEGQMYDLNALCDLSKSDFKVLTVARALNDSCAIVGEGITNSGAKHAFLLTPLPIDGGTWSYVCGLTCCDTGTREGEWVWIQTGGYWWWESGCGCYRWHGPPGDQPPCPPRRPHCWWAPLPCPPDREQSPTPTPTPPRQGSTPTPTPRHPGGSTPTPTPTTTPNHFTGGPVGILPGPTPNRNNGIPVGVLPGGNSTGPGKPIKTMPSNVSGSGSTTKSGDRTGSRKSRGPRTRTGTNTDPANSHTSPNRPGPDKSSKSSRTRGKPTPKPTPTGKP